MIRSRRYTMRTRSTTRRATTTSGNGSDVVNYNVERETDDAREYETDEGSNGDESGRKHY